MEQIAAYSTDSNAGQGGTLLILSKEEDELQDNLNTSFLNVSLVEVANRRSHEIRRKKIQFADDLNWIKEVEVDRDLFG